MILIQYRRNGKYFNHQEKSRFLDPQSQDFLTRLLNQIEAIYKENQELKAENQRLRDEN